MPTPPPPPTPAQQQAQEKMRQWMEQHHPGMPIPGPFGGFAELGLTIQNLVAAAGAGQFAISPDIGDAINKQLTEVQDQVIDMRQAVLQAAADPRFGGGYAEQVSKFVQSVAAGEAGSAEEVLTRYAHELGQLKDAVAKSVANYHGMDASSVNKMTAAGGGS